MNVLSTEKLNILFDKLSKEKLIELLEYLPNFPKQVQSYICINMKPILQKCYPGGIYLHEISKTMSVPYTNYIPSNLLKEKCVGCNYLQKYSEIMNDICKLKATIKPSQNQELISIIDNASKTLKNVLRMESCTQESLGMILKELDSCFTPCFPLDNEKSKAICDIIRDLLEYKFRGYDIYSNYANMRNFADDLYEDVIKNNEGRFEVGYFYSLIHAILSNLNERYNPDQMREIVSYIYLLYQALGLLKVVPMTFFLLIAQRYGKVVANLIKENYDNICNQNLDFMEILDMLKMNPFDSKMEPIQIDFKDMTKDILTVDKMHFFGDISSPDGLPEIEFAKKIVYDIYGLQSGDIYKYFKNQEHKISFFIPFEYLIRILSNYHTAIIELCGNNQYYYIIKNEEDGLYYLLFLCDGKNVLGIQLCSNKYNEDGVVRNVIKFEGLNDRSTTYTLKSPELDQ